MGEIKMQQVVGVESVREQFKEIGQVSTDTLAEDVNAIRFTCFSQALSATRESPSSQVICMKPSLPRSPCCNIGPVSRSGL